MQSLEKHVEKQIIVRMFEPDMNVLKQAARQISAMPDTALNLYGQGGEVLLVAKVRAIAEATATQMAENIADTVLESIQNFMQKSVANLLEARYNKFRKIGEFEEFANQ